MKKITVSVVITVTVLFACHRKAVPVIEPRTVQPPPPATAAVVYTDADIAAGQLIYTAGKCIKCHTAKPVANWTVEGWKPILKSMIPKAKLDSVQKIQVTAYVNTYAKKP